MTWENIKLEILTLSARHCCVCHRYAGLKIEVHHIQPKSKGGKDSLENAIALCFDCHTDAGHYNSEHPRGTKFSPKELLKAKENWFELVKTNRISIPAKISEHLHSRHIVLKNVSLARELLNGKLSGLPIDKPLFVKNHVSATVSKQLSQIGDYYAYVVYNRSFSDIASVLSTYPDILKVNRSDLNSPYYQFVRIPSKEELLSKKDELNALIIQLLNHEVSPHLFVRSIIFEADGCGDYSEDRYVEQFEFRDLWFSFLAIENTSRESLLLSELYSSTNSIILSDFFCDSGEKENVLEFPKAPLKPGETVFISTGIIACPFGYENREDVDLKRNPDTHYELPYTMLRHSVANPDSRDYQLLGDYIRPKSLNYSVYGQKYSCDIHELDPTNLYTINEYSDCGSCPHLFFQQNDERWYYVKELFAKASEVDQLEKIKIESGILKIRIVELENETTFIRFLKRNNTLLYTDLEMIRGNVIEIAVSEGDLIELAGHYEKYFENIPEMQQHVFRNRLIGEYLAKANQRNRVMIRSV